MDKYTVSLYPRAFRDINEIYFYISENLHVPEIASSMVKNIEKAIKSLDQMPERGSIRREGIYGTGEYRQLLVKKYVIVYRIYADKREVHVVTVCHTARNF